MTAPAPFTSVSGQAAALPEDNVDTDIIFPARFLLITARKGLGRYAFHDRRFASDGGEVEDFALNIEPFRNAPILVAGANFGSGSSREQAVWAILDYGIRCVIAPSFGEIFRANCMRNGVLPIALSAENVANLQRAAAEKCRFTVDLETETISVEGACPLSFSVPADRRLAMLNSWDETEQILRQHVDDLRAFETRQRSVQPWLYEES